jgi:NAD(P)-dependent dehydrogenase (short-subunit alcohol dehydrogenase family)
MTGPSSILITGASSGLGRALALEYAAPGRRLALGGRDARRLEETAMACRARGAEISTASVAVEDPAAMAAWVLAEDDARPLDLVIPAAGVMGETGPAGADPSLDRRIYEVNVCGVLNTVHPLLPRLRRRGGGAICLVASLSGLVGIARHPAYCGSKAALVIMGDGWRRALAPHGVTVSVACPGYIDTPMVGPNRYRMPFLVSPERAAREIAKGVAAGRRRIYFPWPLGVAAWLFGAAPPGSPPCSCPARGNSPRARLCAPVRRRPYSGPSTGTARPAPGIRPPCSRRPGRGYG